MDTVTINKHIYEYGSTHDSIIWSDFKEGMCTNKS